MGTSSQLAYTSFSGTPCSPGDESDWQPTDPTSDRSPMPEGHSKGQAASLSPFSRRRGSDPSPAGVPAPARPEPAPSSRGTEPLRALADCEQELAEIAERLGDEALLNCTRKVGLLVADVRAKARQTANPAPSRRERPAAPQGASVRVLFVRSGQSQFGLLESSIGQTHSLSPEESAEHIETAFGARVYRGPTYLLPLINLADVVGDVANNAAGGTSFVSATFGEQSFGLVVDEILGTEEVFVSPMHSMLRKIGLYSGAARRGDGNCALIVDVAGVATKGGMARLSMLPSALTMDPDPQP